MTEAQAKELETTTSEAGQDDGPRKQWAPPPNPFGAETHIANGQRVRLLKSQSEEQRRDGDGAWVIRFAVPPNEMEGHSRENPHPVIAFLKSEGYRWGFDPGDGNGGWGKPFQGDPAGTDLLEAQRVMRKAAEMTGAKVEAERTPF